jgi:hypothetical protein
MRPSIRAWRSGRVTTEPAPARAGAGGDGWRRELEELAHRLGRLSPSWKDPERFAAERSELCAELRRLARANGGEKP